MSLEACWKEKRSKYHMTSDKELTIPEIKNVVAPMEGKLVEYVNFYTRKPWWGFFKSILYIFLLLFIPGLIGFLYFQQLQIRQLTTNVAGFSQDITKVIDENKQNQENITEELFIDHLKVLQNQDLLNTKGALEKEIDDIKNNASTSDLYQVNQVYKNYNDLLLKITRNDAVKLNTQTVKDKNSEWGAKLLSKDFETLMQEITDEANTLDSDYKKYQASIAPPPSSTSKGYSYQTVKIDRGTFGVYLIKLPVSEYSIKTVAAASSDCDDNCPTKSLGDYVKENKAYAGINGSYFCPPDYSTCSGKLNSSDYAFYDSNDGKWYNKSALSWNKTGIMVVQGESPKFYKDTTDFDKGGVSAAISNFPGMLEDGKVVINNDDLTSYQKTGRGLKGSIGRDDKYIYLALVTNATVPDSAYVLKELGIKDALNLDGGGSSAMYINGGYIVGPGRSLPNAVVLVRR